MSATNASGLERVHVLVIGRVQGVYYRSAASEQAGVLGVTGWVRNLPSGEVELCAEGPRELLSQLVAWCRLGPPAARVEEVRAEYAPATGEFTDFQVRREELAVPMGGAYSGPKQDEG
jgi:acylphosphatase